MRVVLRGSLVIGCVLLAMRLAAAQNPQPSSDNLKKVNARPSASPSPANVDAFNNATLAQMSGQCVTLDSEQGAIVIEMLPEKAPQTVRNFMNLAATG